MTLIPASRILEKIRLAVPGTPTIPVPSMLMIEQLSMVAKPFTRALIEYLTPDSTGGLGPMVVPGWSSWKKFRRLTGMECFIAGMVDRGCSTLAPKYDISHASSYASEVRGTAVLTLRGSALNTPSTSVQMVMCLQNGASRAPMMVAE